MITWKQSLSGFEWLIHQVWYLELEHDDKLDKWPRLIPNPRAHLLLLRVINNIVIKTAISHLLAGESSTHDQ